MSDYFGHFGHSTRKDANLVGFAPIFFLFYPKNMSQSEIDAVKPLAETDDFKANLPIVNLSSSKTSLKSKPAVVFLGRVPHGFYEDEMKSYFSQFGVVNRLRLSRNKKTGASKHYAFIEFESVEVAKVVVETMHNYLLSNRLLQCHLMDDDQCHPELFKGAGAKFKVIPWNKVVRNRHNREKTEEEKKEFKEKLLRSEEKKRKQLKELGIDYEFDGYFSKKSKTEESSDKGEETDVVVEAKVVKADVKKSKLVEEKQSENMRTTRSKSVQQQQKQETSDDEKTAVQVKSAKIAKKTGIKNGKPKPKKRAKASDL